MFWVGFLDFRTLLKAELIRKNKETCLSDFQVARCMGNIVGDDLRDGLGIANSTQQQKQP